MKDNKPYIVVASKPGINLLALTETNPFTESNARMLAEFSDATWRPLNPDEAKSLGRAILGSAH